MPLRYSSSGFNPRPPRGGRHDASDWLLGDFKFQSAPPTRGATISSNDMITGVMFQSAPPTRGATQGQGFELGFSQVSIRAPHAGGDWMLLAQ